MTFLIDHPKKISQRYFLESPDQKRVKTEGEFTLERGWLRGNYKYWIIITVNIPTKRSAIYLYAEANTISLDKK